MDKSIEQSISETIAGYYIPITSVEYNTFSEDNLPMLCRKALTNSDLQKKWDVFKSRALSYFKGYKSTTYDTELINNAPSFRYGLEIINDTNQLVTLSFYISLMMPFFSWYFIDREKYPKNSLQKKTNIGPTQKVFSKFGLEAEYNKLNSGEIRSPLDIDLPEYNIIDLLTPSPRFFWQNDEERKICIFLSQQANIIFNGYEYLKGEVGSKEAIGLAPKSVYPFRNYTYFDCLFTASLGYI